MSDQVRGRGMGSLPAGPIPETVDEDDPEFCLHYGDGTPKARCSRCSGSEARAAARANAIVRELQARYDGTCPTCGNEFKAGTVIFERADGRYTCCRGNT